MRLRVPLDFKNAFIQEFGEEQFRDLERTLSESSSPISIRVNPGKIRFQERVVDRVPWCSELACYLKDRPLFGADPLWHAGAYYVQEAGSMSILEYLKKGYGLNQVALECTNRETPKIALDLCAAPGGKSTLLRSVLPKDTLLICNEPDKGRSKILKENLQRWGLRNTIVTSALPIDLAKSGLKCDLILVDAPCSGEGMFRKEEQAIHDWSLSNVELSVARQREILSSAWEMLNNGGILIYSTCTYNRHENENQLKWLQDNYALELLTLEAPHFISLEMRGVYHFFPHLHRSEGFTTFAVRKIEGNKKTETRGKKEEVLQKVRLSGFLREVLGETSFENDVYQYEQRYHLLSRLGKSILSILSQSKGVRILAGGVTLGEEKGRDFIPHQSWVMEPSLFSLLPFPVSDLSGEEVLKLLRRETLNLDSSKQGYHLIRYSGVPISLVKKLSSRINHLYPKELLLRDSSISVTDIPDFTELFQSSICR